MQISTTPLCLKCLILTKLFLYLPNWPESCWPRREQTRRPQSVPQRPVGYSDRKTIKAPMTQAELLTSPVSAAKNLDGGPVPGRVITRELHGGWARLVGWGSSEGKLPPSVSSRQENVCLSSICAPTFLRTLFPPSEAPVPTLFPAQHGCLTDCPGSQSYGAPTCMSLHLFFSC